MTPALHTGLDALTVWRRSLDRALGQLNTLLADEDLLDDSAQALAASLRQRLASDRLVVAFVAEFSRGKSELINALFFGDTGCRILPATPGRTTMCPVELAWEPAQPPSLALLDIDTRRLGQTVSALRDAEQQWVRRTLPLDDPASLAKAFEELRRSRHVSIDEARVLGFWDDSQPDDNPPQDERGLVEVPAWRHALINYPHPMLERGLVVIDTPGLNAIGAEPELTLGLLPTAHAVVFLLAADTGVTRSDLAVWRNHLGEQGCDRYVVLNKIDMLEDPLLTLQQVQGQLETQCHDVMRTLKLPARRLFPMSARRALNARICGDAHALEASGLPALESALHDELLPRQSQVLGRLVGDGTRNLQRTALRRIDERTRTVHDQLAELQSLRGKSAARLALMNSRVEKEAAEFESCVPKLGALRGVLGRQLADVLAMLSADRVRDAVRRMRRESQSSLLRLGASRAFNEMGQSLRQTLSDVERRCAEMEDMLAASQRQLNTEFGFSLAVNSRPALSSFIDELSAIEQVHARYLGLTQLWRQAQPGFMDQFSRMLAVKLRSLFEAVAVEIELWAKAASSQIDDQLRERRRSLAQRREAYGRIQGAETDLEQSIEELQARLREAQRLAERVGQQVGLLIEQVEAGPHGLPAGDEPIVVEAIEQRVQRVASTAGAAA
ncbi:MAG: hypothetical protein RLY78_2579 [Pseudomonadota bacterium]|jgi:hypothetical protein|uniref:Dynamin family protein n=1 Tax=Pseudaquabacterium rugosum TaxID=2984194 RepID=A0ABU9B9C3_9BURK